MRRRFAPVRRRGSEARAGGAVRLAGVALEATQTTMLGTLAGRALDARGRRVLGDDAAVRVMDGLDPETRHAALHGLGVDAGMALSIAVRARMIDDRVHRFLADHPDAVVAHLGCGLDTRYERLAPPTSVTWVEVDHAPVVHLRHRLLGAAGDEHRSIAGSVADPRVVEAIPSGRPTLIVAEGLTMYLTPEVGGALLARIVDRFGARGGGPGGEVVADVVSGLGLRLQRSSPVVRNAGATLRWGIDDPHVLEPLGMRLVEDVQADAMLREARPHLGPAQARLHGLVARTGPVRRMGRLLRYAF